MNNLQSTFEGQDNIAGRWATGYITWDHSDPYGVYGWLHKTNGVAAYDNRHKYNDYYFYHYLGPWA
jgi:hypothetical protein